MAQQTSLTQVIDSAAQSILAAHEQALTDMGNAMFAAAQAASPVRTGRLRSSIELERTPDGGAIVGSAVTYARYNQAPFAAAYDAGVSELRRLGYE